MRPHERLWYAYFVRVSHLSLGFIEGCLAGTREGQLGPCSGLVLGRLGHAVQAMFLPEKQASAELRALVPMGVCSPEQAILLTCSPNSTPAFNNHTSLESASQKLHTTLYDVQGKERKRLTTQIVPESDDASSLPRRSGTLETYSFYTLAG